MAYVGAGTALNNAGSTTHTYTVPAGVTTSHVCILYFAISTGTATTSSVGSLPGGAVATAIYTLTAVGAGESSALYKITGLNAGDTFVITHSVSRQTAAQLWYFTNDFDVPSAYALYSRPGSQATTVPTGGTCSAGQKIWTFATERTTTTGTTVSSIVNGNGRTVTTDYYSDLAGLTNISFLVAEAVETGTTAAATTITYSDAGTSGMGIQVPELVSGPSASASLSLSASATAAGLTSGVAAGVGTTTAKVRIDAVGATSAVVTAATNTGLTTGVVTSGTVTLDSDGLGIASLTGLTAGTDYFFGVALGGGAITADRGNFRTATAGAHNFSFAAASCLTNNGNPTVLDAIRTRTGPAGRTAEFFAQLGDLHYRSRTSPSTATLLADYRTVLATSRPKALLSAIPTEYTWSDHDIGPDNCDSVSLGSTTIANLRNVWSRYWTTYDLPAVNTDTTPYRSWVRGRVRFIMTDGRTYMSDIAATDNSSKTKLGATQKQWLKDEWTAAKAAGQAIVWFHEDGGFNQTTTFAGNDSWSAYTTERAELATFITANGLASRILLIHGDWHNLAADDGTNTSGGIPVACVGPLQQTYVLPANPVWSQGHYPASDPGGNFQQYGWFDVTDTGGSTLTVAFTGYSNDDTGGTAADTSRITMTRTLDAAAPTSGTGSLSLTASGAGRAAATSTGALSLTASATGAARATSTAALTLSGTAATNGTPASGTGALSLSANAGSAATPSAAGTLTLASSATLAARANATALLTLIAVAAGKAPTSGQAALSLVATGTAVTTGSIRDITVTATLLSQRLSGSLLPSRLTGNLEV